MRHDRRGERRRDAGADVIASPARRDLVDQQIGALGAADRVLRTSACRPRARPSGRESRCGSRTPARPARMVGRPNGVILTPFFSYARSLRRRPRRRSAPQAVPRRARRPDGWRCRIRRPGRGAASFSGCRAGPRPVAASSPPPNSQPRSSQKVGEADDVDPECRWVRKTPVTSFQPTRTCAQPLHRAPRPASNRNFCSPASTRMLGPNRFITGAGVPVPSSVTGCPAPTRCRANSASSHAARTQVRGDRRSFGSRFSCCRRGGRSRRWALVAGVRRRELGAALSPSTRRSRSPSRRCRRSRSAAASSARSADAVEWSRAWLSASLLPAIASGDLEAIVPRQRKARASSRRRRRAARR